MLIFFAQNELKFKLFFYFYIETKILPLISLYDFFY